MKRFIAAILFFCVSISFALFNVTQSSAAVSTSPKINAFDTPKAGESLTVTWSAVAGANKYYIGLLDITNGNVDCFKTTGKPLSKAFINKFRKGFFMNQLSSIEWDWFFSISMYS